MASYCGKCGAVLRDGSTFCGACGTPASKKAPSGSQPVATPPTPQRTGGRNARVVAVIAIVVLVALLGVGGYYGYTILLKRQSIASESVLEEEPAVDEAPAFDPTSGHIVHLKKADAPAASGENVFTVSVCKPDGSDAKDVGEVPWSNGVRLLASWNSPYLASWANSMTSKETAELTLLNLETGAKVTVESINVSKPDFSGFGSWDVGAVGDWQFSPKGDTLYYTVYGQRGGTSAGELVKSELKKYEIATGKTTVLSTFASDQPRDACTVVEKILCVAPDNSRLAISTSTTQKGSNSAQNGTTVLGTDGSNPATAPSAMVGVPTMFAADASRLFLGALGRLRQGDNQVDVTTDNTLSNSQKIDWMPEAAGELKPLYDGAMLLGNVDGKLTTYRLTGGVLEEAETLSVPSGQDYGAGRLGSPIYDFLLGFHPSGQGTAYVARGLDTPELHVLTADGDERITNNMVEELDAQWCSW